MARLASALLLTPQRTSSILDLTARIAATRMVVRVDVFAVKPCAFSAPAAVRQLVT
jgi:hypothetical protein